MLEQLLIAAALSAFMNLGVYIAAFKLRIWQRLMIDPCYFCFAFWACTAEYLLCENSGIVPMFGILAVPIASAAISSFLFQYFDLTQE